MTNTADRDGHKQQWWLKINYGRLATLQNLISLGLIIATLFLMASCGSTKTVLLANFKNDIVGSPPSAAQPSGTVTVKAGPGTITVVGAPKPEQPSNKWAGISHPFAQTDLTELTGNFTQFGLGEYGMVCSLHIPEGSGVVTVQFEASDKGPLPFGPFMHLDFMPEGDIRVDDGIGRFGHFPHDTNFVLSVKWSITDTSAIADVTLLGGEASGNKTVTVSSNALPLARQFGAVTFQVGFFHKSTFFVDDILVTRKNP